MITAERTAAYLDSLDPGNAPLIEEIRRTAEAGDVPILRRTAEQLLKALLAAQRPARILEVGAAVGYSAIMMAANTPEETHITTIENWAPRIAAAKENIGRAGFEKKITLLEGDAGGILKEIPDRSFSFIFLDAAKGQYLNWLPDLLRILTPGGMLVSDNVLQEGTVAESRFSVARRERTIHARIREYLFVLTHTEGLVTSVLPVGDGTALTVKTAGSVVLSDEKGLEL